MIQRAIALMMSVLTLSAPVLPHARADGLSDEVLLMPDIGEYLWLVEEYMETAWFGRYFETGALTGRDFYGGFANIDEDGLDELFILVDHKIACHDSTCDLFIFEIDAAIPSLATPCNWRLVEATQAGTKRSLYERFATVDQQTIVLTQLPPTFAARLERRDWFTYFDGVYGTSVDWDEILLSHVRVGTHDVNVDGQDEVFIYVVSPPICGRDECGGAILELSPSEDGSKPDWRWIGELNSLDPADNILMDREAHYTPGRTIRIVEGAEIDGYATLCTRRTNCAGTARSMRSTFDWNVRTSPTTCERT